MAQYSFVKSAGNLLVPATPDAIEFLKTKVKIGAVLYADFSQARNPAFHRKYFSLLNLGFQYWDLPAVPYRRPTKSWLPVT